MYTVFPREKNVRKFAGSTFSEDISKIPKIRVLRFP
jgi:hypothetical protein